MSIYVKRNLKDFISMRCLNSLCVCDKCAIHALIDVVTEQQKEIDELKESKEQPYTAMRSTGIEMDDLVWRPHGKVKDIEPQEDVKEKIKDLIKWHQFWKGNDILTEDLANRILAIVKGE